MISPSKFLFYEFENIRSSIIKGGGDYNTYILNSIGINKNIVFFKLLIPLASICISFLTIIYYCCFFIQYLFKVSIYRRKDIKRLTVKGNILCLCFTPLFVKRVNNTKFDKKESTWIIGPNISDKMTLKQKHQYIEYKDFLVFKDVCAITLIGIKSCLIYMFRYYKYLISVYKGPEYYSVYYSLQNFSENSWVFSNQSDRWAILFDNLPAKEKILLQHGIDYPFDYLLYKLKSISQFYAISEGTWENSAKYLLDCSPELHFLVPTIQLEKIESERHTVLLISYFLFFEEEQKILSLLSSFEMDVYVKLHPTQSDSINRKYYDLQNQYNFKIVKKEFFPKVDFVISYFSTLAYEYNAYNIALFIYSKDSLDVKELECKIRKVLNID